MLTEICAYLKNYFDSNRPKFFGWFEIENGVIRSVNDEDMGLQNGQHFRVVGSAFNDGVWQYGVDELKDETFDGAVWIMGVPPAVLEIAKDVKDWQDKYGNVESAALSPYTSESFGGYSYSKSVGSTGQSGANFDGWKAVFSSRLMPWKKL